MYEVGIIGTGRYAPSNIITNNDVAELVDTSDEWIRERTGIEERRITDDENTSELAVKAAVNALNDANLKADDLDLIIVATITPDYCTPSTACIVQREIGAVNATCFDISAACSGFIYGLSIASQFIKTGQCKTVLVVGCEVLSKIVDWKDRGTCILFADGAGAAVVQRSKEEGIVSVYTGSQGSGAEYLTCAAAKLENPYVKEEDTRKNKVEMNGREIFKFAVNIIVDSTKKVLEDSGYELEDIDHIIPHQANLRIIDFSAKKLKIDKNKFYINLNKYGNTSGASIPLALDEMAKKGLLKKGDKIILVGFGGGLTYGASLIKWNK